MKFSFKRYIAKEVLKTLVALAMLLSAPAFAFSAVALALPVITTQPQSTYGCEGSRVTLSVQANGNNMSYQWQKDSVNIPGATSQTFQLTNANPAQNGKYRVVIRSADEPLTPVISNDANVIVYPKTPIVTEPNDQLVALGTSVQLFVEATVPPGTAFQWYRGAQVLKDGGRITGAQSNILRINNVQTSDTGNNYYVIVTGQCGVDTSRLVRIGQAGIFITSQPVSKVVCSGDAEVIFTVKTNVTSQLQYQWRKGTELLNDDARIKGTKTYTLRIANPTDSDAGEYNVLISSSSSGTPIESAVANLTVTTTAAITTQPVSGSVCAGISLPLTVTASGENLTYQWQREGKDILDGEANTFSASAAGEYRVIVRNPCGEVTSQTVTVTVKTLPKITLQPQNEIFPLGGTLTLSVVAENAVSYQWMQNGNDIPGANSPTYEKINFIPDDTGVYSVRITNDCGDIISNEVMVEIIVNIREIAEMNGYFLKTAGSNPFAEETRITFGAPEYSAVTITLHDISGRIITTLFKNTIDSEEQSFLLKTSDHQLSGGTYSVIMEAKNVHLMRRIVVVR